MNWLTLFNVLYVLVAIAMIAFILMQRGAGAQAGSGFGAGASATVFGAQGSSNFLSKTTRYLAMAFITLSLAMGWIVTHRNSATSATDDLGVMGQTITETPAASITAPGTVTSTSSVPADVPAASNDNETSEEAAPAATETPAAATTSQPSAATATEAEQAPAEQQPKAN